MRIALGMRKVLNVREAFHDFASLDSWESSVKSYPILDYECGVFKVLQTRNKGFSPRSQQCRYRKRDFSQTDSSAVSPLASNCQVEVDAAFLLLATILIKKLKFVIADVYHFTLSQNYLKEGCPVKASTIPVLGNIPNLQHYRCPLLQFWKSFHLLPMALRWNLQILVQR